MKSIVLLCALTLTAACGQVDMPSTVDPQKTTQQGEQWASVDDPAVFGEPLEKRLGALPTQGSVKNPPWVGSYWPKFYDGINYRWAGANTVSAARKYELAFGGTNVEGQVSFFHGVAGAGGNACYSTGSCGPSAHCVFTQGRAAGQCIAIWHGLCHAWATASILHPEPRHPVVYKGVHFGVQDIKALLTIVYNSATQKVVSMRCDLPMGRITFDDAGRPVEDRCRDANPGTYHVLLTNYLGIKGRPFVEDRSMDADVWNQPLRSFQVRKLKAISPSTANQILGIGNNFYPYNLSARQLVYIEMDVGFVKEAPAEVDGYLGNSIDAYTYVDHYSYILELDGAGRIVGGEWVGASKSNHPDFLWLPVAVNGTAVAGGAITYDNVMELVAKSY